MTLYHADPWLTVYQGDCREVMAAMEPGSVHCVVTSPPYWGLRDYGVAGALGLEPTPEEFVANMVGVFREVRRVLRDDGTCWVNLGDSFGDKQLQGIPWRVAFALQQPYYAGRITREADRAWLAAMIDGEGSIDVNRLRADSGNRRKESFGTYVRVHNTSEAIVRRCAEIAGVGSVALSDERRQPVYVWAVYGDNARMVLREIYPYLVGKQQQARLAAAPSDETCAALRLLHHGSDTTVERPAPESATEPGWYLRSDIIWAKPNPMPESVTDRPTKAHEYVFLLSKSARYWYDAEAVREPHNENTMATTGRAIERGGGRQVVQTAEKPGRGDGDGKPLFAERWLNPAGRNIRSVWSIATQPYPGAHFATFPEKLVEPCIKAGCPDRVCSECGAGWLREVERGRLVVPSNGDKRPYPSPRSDGHDQGVARSATHQSKAFYPVTTLGWSPSCAHDAPTVPGTVLDPFAGSGTTGRVAQRLSRRAVLIDLNGEYLVQAMGRNRELPLGLEAS